MPETYGERVARARYATGLSQGEWAARAGIPKRTLQDIESGKVVNPQRRTRDAIDHALNLHSEGETAEEWPPDLRAFLDILGAMLIALPEEERQAYILDAVQRLATWNRQ